MFWFFGGFRCDVWLFFVILVRYKKEHLEKQILGLPLGNDVHLAVAGDVFGGFFVLPYSH